MTSRSITLAVILCHTNISLGQMVNIDSNHAFSWSENTGWLNWSEAPGVDSGAIVSATHLSGFIWSENTGWVNLGDGSPTDGTHYSNVNGTDFGVNIDQTTGDLFGFAWGENIGWLNFDTREALTGFQQQARLDRDLRRFQGFAWGESVGWINLDDSTHFVALRCLADWNGDSVFNTNDLINYLNDYRDASLGMPPTFGDPDIAAPFGILNTADFVQFLNEFNDGCTT